MFTSQMDEMSTTSSIATAGFLARSVYEARRRYRKRLARCQRNFSEDAVHELRIETRRLLALLDLLLALGAAPAADKIAKRFKKRLDVFDELRDTQVQLRLLEPLWGGFPEAESFKAFLVRREARLIARLAHGIQDTKSARLNRRLEDPAQGVGPSRRGGPRRGPAPRAGTCPRGSRRTQARVSASCQSRKIR